ncbi:hypothetical protein ACFL2C_01590 [Patescibacteria group bacterium]
MQRLLDKHERRFTRCLEMLPGMLAWTLILLPAVGGFFFPELIAYGLLVFVSFWFIKSFRNAYLSIKGYYLVKSWLKINWKNRFEKVKKKDYSWNDIYHVIIIPAYKEPDVVIKKALNALKNQKQLDSRNLIVYLGFEKRDPGSPKQAKRLVEQYRKYFGALKTTFHPPDLPNEIPGKASNEAWVAKKARLYLKKKNIPLAQVTVTSCDVDTIFHKHYFAALTYFFIRNPKRYLRFWQSAIFWYNNIHKVPFPIKMLGVIGHAIHLSDLQEPSRLIFNQSSYSLSFKLLDDVGYWHTDIIPEDWHLFLQTFFAKSGEIEVEPIFLPTHIDAPEGATWFGSIKNRYSQSVRHAWGASDIPYAIKESIRHHEIPISLRFMRVYKLLETHIIWSTNWFILTLGAFLPVLINPAFARTSLGHNLPEIAEAALTVCLLALAVMIIVDLMLRPKSTRPQSPFQYAKEVVQWITLPIVTLPLSVLPGLHAHTMLMVGKRLDYKTTKKV